MRSPLHRDVFSQPVPICPSGLSSATILSKKITWATLAGVGPPLRALTAPLLSKMGTFLPSSHQFCWVHLGHTASRELSGPELATSETDLPQWKSYSFFLKCGDEGVSHIDTPGLLPRVKDAWLPTVLLCTEPALGDEKHGHLCPTMGKGGTHPFVAQVPICEPWPNKLMSFWCDYNIQLMFPSARCIQHSL